MHLSSFGKTLLNYQGKAEIAKQIGNIWQTIQNQPATEPLMLKWTTHNQASTHECTSTKEEHADQTDDDTHAQVRGRPSRLINPPRQCSFSKKKFGGTLALDKIQRQLLKFTIF